VKIHPFSFKNYGFQLFHLFSIPVMLPAKGYTIGMTRP
jgi:hypothetical protein